MVPFYGIIETNFEFLWHDIRINWNQWIESQLLDFSFFEPIYTLELLNPVHLIRRHLIRDYRWGSNHSINNFAVIGHFHKFPN